MLMNIFKIASTLLKQQLAVVNLCCACINYQTMFYSVVLNHVTLPLDGDICDGVKFILLSDTIKAQSRATKKLYFVLILLYL